MIASLLALTLCLSSPGAEPSISPTVVQTESASYDPQKLRRAIGIKWLGAGAALAGGLTLTMPVAIAGSALYLFGIIAQDVHTVRLSEDHARASGLGSSGSASVEEVAQDISRVQAGSMGMYAVNRSYRTAFLVIEVTSESDDDKVLRIEFTNERGERTDKLVRASNAKITFTDY